MAETQQLRRIAPKMRVEPLKPYSSERPLRMRGRTTWPMVEPVMRMARAVPRCLSKYAGTTSRQTAVEIPPDKPGGRD